MSNNFQIKRGSPDNLQLKPGEFGFHTTQNQLFIGREGAGPLAIGPTDLTEVNQKTLYATDKNKSGNIELFFGILLPSFILKDDYGIGLPFNGYGDKLTFNFEEGMTWEQWVSSKYCTIKEYVSVSEYGISVNGYPIYFADEWACPLPSEQIMEDYEYRVSG